MQIVKWNKMRTCKAEVAQVPKTSLESKELENNQRQYTNRYTITESEQERQKKNEFQPTANNCAVGN